MTVWIYSKCGMAGGFVLEGRPSLDERYAVGYCAGSCTPEQVIDPATRKLKPRERATVALVRNQDWDPDLLRRRREADEEARFCRDFAAGKFKGRAQEEAAGKRMSELRARWAREAAERRSA